MRAMGEVLYREDYGLAELCPSSLPAGPCLFPRRPHTLREETLSLLARVLGPWIALSLPSLDASLYILNGIDMNNEQPLILKVDVGDAPSGASFGGGKLGSWADKCRFWGPVPTLVLCPLSSFWDSNLKRWVETVNSFSTAGT